MSLFACLPIFTRRIGWGPETVAANALPASPDIRLNQGRPHSRRSRVAIRSSAGAPLRPGHASTASPIDDARPLSRAPGANGQLVALPDDVISMILSHVHPDDGAAVAAVCKRLEEAMREHSFWERALRRECWWSHTGVLQARETWAVPDWREAYCRTERPKRQLYLYHKLGAGDTLAGLSLRHRVSTHAIKRTNCIMDEHVLTARGHVYIPIKDAPALSSLECDTMSVHFDPALGKTLLVTHVNGSLDCNHASDDGMTDAQKERIRKAELKLAGDLKYAFGNNVEAASAYIAMSKGRAGEAMRQFANDLRWEQSDESKQHPLAPAALAARVTSRGDVSECAPMCPKTQK